MFATVYVLVAQNIFGEVEAPPGVVTYGDLRAGGLVLFISNLIKVVTLIAGLFGLFNIIGAGYTYLNAASNPKATEQAMQQLTYSLIGLSIIVGSFAIAAIVGFILFGDATFIINPRIPTAQGATP